MKTLTLKMMVVAGLLAGLGLGAACKSEIDDKAAAKVEDVKKDDAAATNGGEMKKDDMAATNGGEMKKEEPKAAEAAGAFKLDSASTIGFIGAKVTGDHKGGFKTFEGSADVADGKLSALMVTVQTDSIFSDAEKLTEHLKSPDFFDTAKFPTATFKLTEATEDKKEGQTHMVAGELMMHGVTKKVTFPANVEVTDGEIKAKADFKVNRKDFEIVYAGKPDDLIKDEVALQLDLTFKK